MIIAVVVVLLIVLGSRAENSGGTSADTTSADGQAASQARSSILAIQQEDAVPAFVLLVRTGSGGVALGLPGMTLVKTPEGFKTLSELYAAEKTDALLAGLNSDLGTDAASLTSIKWPDLLEALEKAGSAETWAEVIDDDPEGAMEAAGALLSMLGASASSPGSGSWGDLQISGDAAALRSFVDMIASSIAGGVWTKAVLPGKVTESLDVTFYEPDVASAKSLLMGETDASAITLEVQNGSGTLDGAQIAGDVLESLGFKMAPFANAEDFPDVAKTTISAASDVLTEAGKVKDLLGVGTVRADGSLSAGHILVVVGKDFKPAETSN